MKKGILLAVIIVFSNLCYAVNPTVSNVTVSNLYNNNVDAWIGTITYNLADPDTKDSIYVWADYSIDAGATWFTYLYQTESIGYQKPGTGKSIRFRIPYIFFTPDISDQVIIRAYAQDFIAPDSLRLIPAGSFTMGGDEAGAKPHLVTLTYPFLMDRTEVTFAMYNRVMKYTPLDNIWGDYNRPVGQICYWDAILFCNARSKAKGLDTCYTYSDVLYDVGSYGDSTCSSFGNLACNFTKKGYRLPTEAEWEYACRAGTTTKYWWGDELNDDTDTAYVWYYANTTADTLPTGNSHVVGQKKPNAFGLYDMLGNNWEWVNDWYEPYDTTGKAAVDPVGSSNSGGSVIRRGGAYFLTNSPSSMTCFHRQPNFPNVKVYDTGFRCVRRL